MASKVNRLAVARAKADEMETLAKSKSETPVLLSNVEVLELLEKQLGRRKKDKKHSKKKQNKFQHRDWIEDRVFAYLKDTPCKPISVAKRSELKRKLKASADKKVLTESSSSTGNVDDASESASTTPTGFGLTEAESIQILNFMPRQPVDVHVVIEELQSRMTEKRQTELLELVESYVKDGEKNKGGEGK